MSWAIWSRKASPVPNQLTLPRLNQSPPAAQPSHDTPNPSKIRDVPVIQYS
jgi:hypothetical protein